MVRVMRTLTPYALALSAALASGPSSGADEIPFIDIAGETDRQVVVDREPGQYLGHPTTCLLDDGETVLCVYPKGHGRGAVIYKRSADGGRTWSERLPTPASWASSKETPTLFRTTDAAGKKRILMFSGLHPVRMAVSEDEGATWGELEPIGDFGGIVAMGTMIEVKGEPGHYRALFHDDGRFFRAGGKRATPPVMTLYQTLSTDGGLTWGEPEAIFASAEIHLCEPGAVRSPDGGQIAVLLRENARRKNSFVIFSDDEGRSWSAPRELPITLTGDRHTAGYFPDGRLFISFRCRTPGVAKPADSALPGEGDWAAWVGTYQDIADNQPGQYCLRIADNTKSWDTTYPGVEVLPDGTVLTTTYGHWDEGEAPYILSVRLRADELDARAARAGALVLGEGGMEVERHVPVAPARKIWDAAPHNAFTDLVRWDGKWLCSFREGSGHVPGSDGEARVIASADGERWDSFVLLEEEGIDLRDPKLSVAPDGRLMLLVHGADYRGKDVVRRGGFVAFAEPGGGFGGLQEIELDPAVATDFDWLWRVTWHGGTGYGVVYRKAGESWSTALFSTEDGLRYQLVAPFEIAGRPNEATVRFDHGDGMHVVVRNEASATAQYGVAAPPYTDFAWRPINTRLGGPDLLQLPDGSWLLGTRRYSKPTRTGFGLLDGHGGFEIRALVPSAGDTSYPGMVVEGDSVWVSYYSSHEGKTAIYLAVLPLAWFR